MLGGKLTALNTEAGDYMNIFMNQTFNTDGYISKVKFYSAITGTFFLAIWRPVKSSYELVNTLSIQVANSGLNVSLTYFNSFINRKS